VALAWCKREAGAQSAFVASSPVADGEASETSDVTSYMTEVRSDGVTAKLREAATVA
jgi:hypothetical protein